MGQAAVDANLDRLVSDLSRLWPDQQDQERMAKTILALRYAL